MGFLDRMRQVLGGRSSSVENWRRVSEAWGLVDPDDDSVSAGPMPEDPDEPTAYDRAQWRKKMRRILEGLPGSRPEWDALQYEARSLELDPEWVGRCQRDEFGLMIRRAVADGILTGQEHRTIDLARDLIGMPDGEAEDLLHAIVAEAEAFFGKPVEEA